MDYGGSGLNAQREEGRQSVTASVKSLNLKSRLNLPVIKAQALKRLTANCFNLHPPYVLLKKGYTFV
jgi:hypothetical protein